MRFKFTTWNIDTNLVKTEEGYARESHPQWKVANRVPAICKEISRMNPDVLNLQELRKTNNKYGETIDSLTPLKDYLESTGYRVLINPYNDTGDKAFQFITAYRQDKFELISTKLKYFTKTPDQATIHPDTIDKSAEEIKTIEAAIKDNNYGEFFERGTFITHPKYIETGQELVDFNVHLGIPVAHRIKASELINEFTKQELVANPNAKIVISSDFNSFPGRQGSEQMDIIKTAEFENKPLLTEVTDNLYLPDKQPMPDNTTFIFFPFDYGPNDVTFKDDIAKLSNLEATERKETINKIFSNDACKASGGQLDHIFIHSLE